MATSSNKNNKILSIAVCVLLLTLIGVVVWQIFFGRTYSAVFLRTGDLYFGKLVNFPNFGLKNVYMIQANPQNPQSPLSIQKFTNVFWGPQDYLKINRSEVVWTAKLSPKSQLLEVLKSNPDLLPDAQNTGTNQIQTPPPQPQAPAPENNAETPPDEE